jgi:hypothetical protein
MFGTDYMETGGDRVKMHFDVAGDVINVRAEGATGTLQFKVTGKNRMVMIAGFGEVPFNKVK